MKKITNFLLSPWLIFFSVILGSVIGFYYPDFAKTLTPFGSLYLKLLQMLVLPVLMAAIISGLGRLFISGTAKKYLVQVLIFLVTNLLLATLIGTSLGYIGGVGNSLDQQANIALGKTISSTNIELVTSSDSSGWYLFAEKMIPHNIFQALVNGNNLAVLFFSILVGTSLGLVGSDSSKIALEVMDAFYETFLMAINWMMYLLPFGLCCLFASQLSQIGLDIFWAMSKLVLYIYLSAFLLIFIFSLVIWYKSQSSYWQMLIALRQPFFVGLGTASGFASIPASLNALQEKLKVKKDISNLILPLGMTINPPGSVLYFGIAGVFMAQIYDIPLSFSQLAVMGIGSILAGISSSSAPGIVGLGMISMILIPLGLPVEVAIILLIAIDPVVDPILTVVNVFSNCAMTMVANNHINN